MTHIYRCFWASSEFYWAARTTAVTLCLVVSGCTVLLNSLPTPITLHRMRRLANCFRCWILMLRRHNGTTVHEETKISTATSELLFGIDDLSQQPSEIVWWLIRYPFTAWWWCLYVPGNTTPTSRLPRSLPYHQRQVDWWDGLTQCGRANSSCNCTYCSVKRRMGLQVGSIHVKALKNVSKLVLASHICSSSKIERPVSCNFTPVNVHKTLWIFYF